MANVTNRNYPPPPLQVYKNRRGGFRAKVEYDKSVAYAQDESKQKAAVTALEEAP
jgi:hypothetical protein